MASLGFIQDKVFMKDIIPEVGVGVVVSTGLTRAPGWAVLAHRPDYVSADGYRLDLDAGDWKARVAGRMGMQKCHARGQIDECVDTLTIDRSSVVTGANVIGLNRSSTSTDWAGRVGTTDITVHRVNSGRTNGAVQSCRRPGVASSPVVGWAA